MLNESISNLIPEKNSPMELPSSQGTIPKISPTNIYTPLGKIE